MLNATEQKKYDRLVSVNNDIQQAIQELEQQQVKPAILGRIIRGLLNNDIRESAVSVLRLLLDAVVPIVQSSTSVSDMVHAPLEAANVYVQMCAQISETMNVIDIDRYCFRIGDALVLIKAAWHHDRGDDFLARVLYGAINLEPPQPNKGGSGFPEMEKAILEARRLIAFFSPLPKNEQLEILRNVQAVVVNRIMEYA